MATCQNWRATASSKLCQETRDLCDPNEGFVAWNVLEELVAVQLFLPNVTLHIALMVNLPPSADSLPGALSIFPPR